MDKIHVPNSCTNVEVKRVRMTEKKEILLAHHYLSSALLQQTHSLRKAGGKVYIRRINQKNEKVQKFSYLILKVKR